MLKLGQEFEEKFYAAMDQDFGTANALGNLFELARAINRFSNHKKAKKRGGPVVQPALRAFESVCQALGLMGLSSDDFQNEVKAKRLTAMGIDRGQIEQLLQDRTDARANKDWARADAIRDELDEKGIVVMDRPGGVDWRVCL